MNCDELLWSSGVTFLGGVTLDAVDRNHPTTTNELNIQLAGFDQRSDPRCGDPEVRRRVFKRSTRRFSRALMVDFDRKGHDLGRTLVLSRSQTVVEVVGQKRHQCLACMCYCFFTRVTVGKGARDLWKASAVTVVFFYEDAIVGKSLLHRDLRLPACLATNICPRAFLWAIAAGAIYRDNAVARYVLCMATNLCDLNESIVLE